MLVSVSQMVNIKQRKQAFLNIGSTVSLSQRISGILLRKTKENKFLGVNFIEEHRAVQRQENKSPARSLAAASLRTFS